MTMHYYLRDHEGNVRVVADGDGKVEQVNHYYPFGGLMGKSTGSSVQLYKYNGKELDRFLGWNMLDYGARWYDSKLQCWSTPDLLAEKYYHLSPYVYCANSPVNLIDKDGKEPDDFFFTIDEAAKDFGMYYNGISIAENVEYASSIYMVINSDNKIGFTYTSANRVSVINQVIRK